MGARGPRAGYGIHGQHVVARGILLRQAGRCVHVRAGVSHHPDGLTIGAGEPNQHPLGATPYAWFLGVIHVYTQATRDSTWTYSAIRDPKGNITTGSNAYFGMTESFMIGAPRPPTRSSLQASPAALEPAASSSTGPCCKCLLPSQTHLSLQPQRRGGWSPTCPNPLAAR